MNIDFAKTYFERKNLDGEEDYWVKPKGIVLLLIGDEKRNALNNHKPFNDLCELTSSRMVGYTPELTKELLLSFSKEEMIAWIESAWRSGLLNDNDIVEIMGNAKR